MQRLSGRQLILALWSNLAWIGLCLFLYQYFYPVSPNLLPAIPLVLLCVLATVYHFEGFLYTMVGLVPLSINIIDIGGGVGLALPGEALLMISAAGFMTLILRRQLDPMPLLRHPIGLVIIVQMAWVVVTMLASTYTEISTKFLLARCIYILVYFIGFGSIFLQLDRITSFFKAYIWGMVPVSIYAIYVLWMLGMSRNSSPVMAEPFFDDHTVFGNCLAMILPMAIWIAARDRVPEKRQRFPLRWLVVALLLVALLLSFSRAAWMALFVMAGMWLILRLKIKFRFFAAGLVVVAAGLYIGRDALVQRFEENENVSGEDVFSTAASVTNVNSDDSNKERINRWACAIRMFEERPWFGFGPGTYEKNYGDYQVLQQLTRISSFHGDRGDAHSEYLGALSEQGLLGMLLLGGLFLMTLRTGMRVVYRTQDPKARGLATAVVLGLSSFYFHGFVNDFYDLDKAACLIWSMMAVLAALDIRESQAEGQRVGN